MNPRFLPCHFPSRLPHRGAARLSASPSPTVSLSGHSTKSKPAPGSERMPNLVRTSPLRGTFRRRRSLAEARLVRGTAPARVVALAGYEARVVGGEEMDDGCHFLLATHAPHRDLGGQTPDVLRRKLREQGRLDQCRRHRVDPDAVAYHLLGESLGQADHTGLGDAVGAAVALPSLPPMEAMFTMAPLRRSRMWPMTARQLRKTEVRLIAISASHSSSVTSHSGALRPLIPALLTRISSRPKLSSVCSTMAATSSGRVTSVRMLNASPLAAPRCSTAAAALSSSLSAMTTLAPACESRSEIAYPMPDAPSVTTATLSLSSKNTLPSLPHVLVRRCPGVLKAHRPVGPRGLVDRERDAQRLYPLSPAHQRLRLAMLHGGGGPFGRALRMESARSGYRAGGFLSPLRRRLSSLRL